MFGRPAALRALGLAACAAAPLLTAGVAQASIITFTNRSLFEAALSSSTTFDFNGVAEGTQLDNLSVGYDFGPFSINDSGGGGQVYIRNSTSGTASSGIVDGTNFVRYNENASGLHELIVTFDTAVQALGVDFNNPSSDTALDTFDVYVTLGSTDYLVAAAGTSGFFGALSTDASMTQAVFNLFDYPTKGSGVLGLDNFTWGTPVAAVPAPAALPLFASAVAGFGLFAGRRGRGKRAILKSS